MPGYSRYTTEQKIQACEDYLSGARSVSQICIDSGMSSKNGMNMLKMNYGALWSVTQPQGKMR